MASQADIVVQVLRSIVALPAGLLCYWAVLFFFIGGGYNVTVAAVVISLATASLIAVTSLTAPGAHPIVPWACLGVVTLLNFVLAMESPGVSILYASSFSVGVATAFAMSRKRSARSKARTEKAGA